MAKRGSIAVMLLVNFCGVSAYTQDTILDPVTVTASLSQKRISETGRNIIIIKGDQFNKLPVHSIDELLRYVPGVEVQLRGPGGSQSDVLIRGGTFQQVLVVLDGTKLNDPLTGHFNSYIPIAPSEIERIEILKGASSAIYGTEAVGGVIQIITKTFASRQKSALKQAGGQVSGGQYGMFNAGTGGFFQRNNTAIAGGVLTNNADGVQQRGIHGFFHNTTISASLKQYLGKNWNIALRSAYDRRNFAAQNFYTVFASDTATEKVTSWWNQVRLAYTKQKQSFSLDIGYKTARDAYFFASKVLPNRNKSKLAQVQAVYNYNIGTNTQLTSGVQFVNQSISSNDRGDHSVSNAGAFIIINQKLFRKLQVSPAVRVDRNELSGWELVPQVNASFQLKHFIIRGSAGKTTRNADFTERYNNYNKPGVTAGNIGNPNLEAEHSFSWEAGTDYYFAQAFKMAVTYFQKDYSHLIDWVNVPYAAMPRKDNLSPTGNYFLAMNISDVLTRGVEADLQFARSMGTKQSLFSSAGLIWLHSRTNNNTPSLYISSHADFIFNFTVDYRYGFLELGLNGLYKQQPPQAGNAILAPMDKDYFVLNLRVNGMILKNKLGLFVMADNIFDRRYADRFGVPMPGNWWTAGIQVNLEDRAGVKNKF